MHNEPATWPLTWQVIILGVSATFAFLGLLIACLQVMSKLVKRGADNKKTQPSR